MRLWHSVALLLFAGCVAVDAQAQGTISSLPRKETLIVENPEGTIKNAGWFNIWAINAGGQSTGLQQLAMDTLLVHRPAEGRRRRVGQFARLREADLQRRLHRDDGEAAQGHLLERRRRVHRRRRGLHRPDAHEDQRHALERAGAGQRRRASRRPIRNTVVFKLKKPNSRFHALFTVRWNAMWMMPKHVFEKVGDPLKFDFNTPVSLGAYTLNSYDPERQVVHLAEARRLAAHHASRASASPGRNTSPTSIPARRTSA